jgi:catechol 2,3-dioxygenase-like lactoylglutathione lyase family enzyme
MALGTYVELSTTVEDGDKALEFYAQLGFQYRGYSIVTDGSINLNLAPEGVPAPMLRYAGGDVEQVLALEVGASTTPRGLAAFETPEGLHVMVSPHESRIPMPEGTPFERTPVSRCGKLGEYALPVGELTAALAFWEKLGFLQIHATQEPYPWAILTDDLIILGLHQTTDFSEPHLTYFAPDMAERIKALQADGIPIQPLAPDVANDVVNASFRGPGGEQFFLFQGEI